MFKAANRECLFHIWALWCTVVVYTCMLPCFSVYKLPVTYCPFGDSFILRKIYIINRRLFWIWIWTATTSNSGSKFDGEAEEDRVNHLSILHDPNPPPLFNIDQWTAATTDPAAVKPSQVVVRRPGRIYFHKASKVMAALKLVWKCCQSSRTMTE